MAFVYRTTWDLNPTQYTILLRSTEGCLWETTRTGATFYRRRVPCTTNSEKNLNWDLRCGCIGIRIWNCLRLDSAAVFWMEARVLEGKGCVTLTIDCREGRSANITATYILWALWLEYQKSARIATMVVSKPKFLEKAVNMKMYTPKLNLYSERN